MIKLLFLVQLIVLTLSVQVTPEELVYKHVQTEGPSTYRNADGYLTFPYLVPAGPYNELWDWDSMFTGIAMLNFKNSSAPYLSGSMKNFLNLTDSDGEVKGCLTPSGASGTIFHAKPLIIQSAWILTLHLNNSAEFQEFKTHMSDLLKYWKTDRKDNETGLYVWYNQLESGDDNLVISTCPSSYSPCWNATIHEKAIASSDVMTFLYREFKAYANFLTSWGEPQEEIDAVLAEAESIKNALHTHLWDEELGIFIAYNVTARKMGIAPEVYNRVWLMGMPLLDKELIVNQSMVSSIKENILKGDMYSQWGIRSVSSSDPRYNNDNIIDPYSNWRGPMWVNANVMVTYGLMEQGYLKEALEIQKRVIETLAEDLENDNSWHECYSTDDGTALAATGFLSWNTLAAEWGSNLRSNINPFSFKTL